MNNAQSFRLSHEALDMLREIAAYDSRSQAKELEVLIKIRFKEIEREKQKEETT
jgi:hypothetical protein